MSSGPEYLQRKNLFEQTGCPKVSVTTLISHNYCIDQQTMKPFGQCIHERIRFFGV